MFATQLAALSGLVTTVRNAITEAVTHVHTLFVNVETTVANFVSGALHTVHTSLVGASTSVKDFINGIVTHVAAFFGAKPAVAPAPAAAPAPAVVQPK